MTGLPEGCDLFTPGHRACGGCGPALAARLLLKATGENVIVVNSTGCMEVFSTPYPETTWGVPWIHSLFENAAAVASGIEASLKKQGRSEKVVCICGDGATFDIGMLCISGAFERGHDITYVCYDNEAYMNTGIQRSGATPRGANTTTSPAGTESYGKKQYRKDLSAVMVAHEIPYVAQASPSNWNDLVTKVKKALAVEGPAFMNIIQPCVLGWKYPSDQSIELAKLAVDTCFWPLYEVENGEYKLTYRPKEKKPVEDWLKRQGRFRHLFKPENAEILKEIQEDIDTRWSRLLAKCGEEA